MEDLIREKMEEDKKRKEEGNFTTLIIPREKQNILSKLPIPPNTNRTLRKQEQSP